MTGVQTCALPISPLEDAAEDVYDSFLKSNDQDLGIRSYGACVDLLVNYFGEKL